MELNTQIKKYRSSLNLSQEELAEKVYVARQSVSKWESGQSIGMEMKGILARYPEELTDLLFGIAVFVGATVGIVLFMVAGCLFGAKGTGFPS